MTSDESSLPPPPAEPPAEPPTASTTPDAAAPPGPGDEPRQHVAAGSRRSTRFPLVLSWIVIAAGVILIAAGAATWLVVRDELADERITVSADADFFAGDRVDGPLSAFSEAETISQHALDASDGKTYAELPRDDPARNTVMTASFLRASLFTSVVSFGVALFAAGMGVLMIVIGVALLRLASLVGDSVSVSMLDPREP